MKWGLVLFIFRKFVEETTQQFWLENGEISPNLERKWVCVYAWVCCVCDLSFGIKFLTILFMFVIEFV